MKKRYTFEVTGKVEILAESENEAFAEVAYYYPNDWQYGDARLVDVKDE